MTGRHAAALLLGSPAAARPAYCIDIAIPALVATSRVIAR